jgi:hypothetical protein
MTRVSLMLLSLLAIAALGLVACEGDDDQTTEADSPRQATLSQEQKIERTGNRWARLFAAGHPAACRYMTPQGCARIKCERGPKFRLRRSQQLAARLLGFERHLAEPRERIPDVGRMIAAPQPGPRRDTARACPRRTW